MVLAPVMPSSTGRDEEAAVVTGVVSGPGAGYIGRRLPRREDGRLVTGHGTFAGDLAPERLAHLAVLRSPIARGRIRFLELDAVRALPGVLAAWGASDLSDCAANLPDAVAGVVSKPRPLLAGAEVRHVGDPIAVVVAETPYLAADAVQAIPVDLDPLPGSGGVCEAAAPGAPLVHSDVPANLGGRIVRQTGDVDAAFGAGVVVERGRFFMGRVAGAALEPRTATATWEGDRLTLWTSTSGHFRVRDALVSVLGLDRSAVRVLVPDVGGSFGAKGTAYPEEVLVGLAARRLGRPVRYTGSRSEDMASTNQAHGIVLDLQLATDSDGRLRGLRGTLLYPLGAYAVGGVPERPLQHLLSAYRLPAVRLELRAYFTNTAPTGAIRGGGRPVGNFGIERMMDRLARRLGIDPLELRRRNLVGVHEMPYDTGLEFGTVRTIYDSGDFPRLLEAAANGVGYPDLRRRQRDGEPIGVAVSLFTESTGLGSAEAARARIEPGGRAVFFAGSAPGGQGHLTTLAQVGAERLSWPLQRVEVVAGDSSAVAGRLPTGGSRTAVEAGNAVARAAAAARTALRERAGELLEADAADVEIAPEGAWVQGTPARRLALRELVGDGLEVAEVFEGRTSTFASGAVAVVAEVDPETCAPAVRRCVFAHDSGREINPMVVEGQVHGGYAHGVGYALYEEAAYEDGGNFLTSTFLDYPLVTAPELSAEPEVLTLATLTAHNPEGFKGTGESGAVPTPGAVANAVEDALHQLGHRVSVDDLPITPDRLFELMREDADRQPGRRPDA
jgi:carbon-monoxide dehydrogenase large subunit